MRGAATLNAQCPCAAEATCRRILPGSLAPLPCEADYAGPAQERHATRLMRLGPVQAAVLTALQRYGELSMSGITDAVAVKRQSVHYAIEKLVRNGLVRSLRTPSKRSGRLYHVKYAALTDQPAERVRVRH